LSVVYACAGLVHVSPETAGAQFSSFVAIAAAALEPANQISDSNFVTRTKQKSINSSTDNSPAHKKSFFLWVTTYPNTALFNKKKNPARGVT